MGDKLEKVEDAAEIEAEWRTVLRLPHKTAEDFKKLINAMNEKEKANDRPPISLNSAIRSIVEVWVREEKKRRRV